MNGFNKENFIEAIKLANKELITYINNDLKQSDLTYTNTTGFGGDNSLKIDIIAENIFIKYLSSFGDIFSEECGLLSDNSDYKIIIDPLDGSNNFLHQLPYYGTSISLKYKDRTIAGFVTNLNTSLLTYKIEKDLIKYFNLLENKYFQKLTVNNKKLAIFESSYKNSNICSKLSKHNIKYRSPGALAVSLCDAKNYKFVLFKGPVRDFDIDAALFINNDLFLYKNDDILILSENKKDFDLVLEIIKDI